MFNVYSDTLFLLIYRLGMARSVLKEISKKRRRAYHIVCVALLIISLAFSVFRFPQVGIRVWQSLVDLIFSLGFYGTKVAHNLGWINSGAVVRPTVVNIPDGMESLLPIEWDKFVELFEVFINRLFDFTYLDRYMTHVGNGIADVSEILLLFIIPMTLLIVVLTLVYSFENNEHNKDSSALKRYKSFERKILQPIKETLTSFACFLRERWYWTALGIVWAWNFSVTTIFFEFFAWLFYFSVSQDFLTIYTQIVKLVVDLTVPVFFLPRLAWWIIGLKVFDIVRKKIAVTVLKAKEEVVKGFLELYSWSIFIVGKMRAKKTTMLTLFKRILERVFRDKAEEKFFQRDMQFPNFPWIYPELMVKLGKRGSFRTLESCRAFVAELKTYFYKRNKYTKEETQSILRRLRKRYGYPCNDFIFDYDYKTYGLKYDTGTTIIDVFFALEMYMQLFQIYNQRSPLDISTYSIREDIKWDDKGNYPKYDGDFYDRKPENVKRDSKYSHRMNFDIFRLGKVFDNKCDENDSVEYAIGVFDETDKERKNMITKRGTKASANLANQENDLFETDTKMRPGHAALVDNYPFFRWLMAAQRPTALGADNRDMTVEVYIKGVSEAKLAMPGFAFEEALYVLMTPIVKKVYYSFRNLRGDNTLFIYLLKKFYGAVFNHYWRVFNKYSYYVATVKVSDSQDNEVLEKEKKIPIPTCIVYAEVFASNSHSGFYSAKARRSNKGLNEIPMYKGVRPTFEELQEQKSYFIEDISESFGVQCRRTEERVDERAA